MPPPCTGAPRTRGIAHDSQHPTTGPCLAVGCTEGGIHELAEALDKEASDNADVVATYAFSLYERRKDDEALGAMQTLQPEQLRQPGVARYYGIILTATGHGAEALEYLTLGEQGFVLPEEKILLAQAKATASRAAAKPR